MTEQERGPRRRCYLCDGTAAAGTWRVKHGATRWCCRECGELDNRCRAERESDALIGAVS